MDAEYLSILSEPKSLRTDLKKQIRNFCQMMITSHLQSPVDIQSELTQHFYQNILDMLNNNYSYDGKLILISNFINIQFLLHLFLCKLTYKRYL